MKKIIYSLFIIFFLFLLVGCSFNKYEINADNQQHNNMSNNESNDENKVIESMKAVINGKEYIINLEDNETVKEFVNVLPQKLMMNDLNGNEKYVYLDYILPTSVFNPKRINVGDVMLYGDNCLVIFYKSFDTTYSYTKIGHIDNLGELESGSIVVEFKSR